MTTRMMLLDHQLDHPNTPTIRNSYILWWFFCSYNRWLNRLRFHLIGCRRYI